MKHLGLIAKAKLFSALSKATDQIQDGIEMKNVTKILMGVSTALTALYYVPGVQDAISAFAAAHKQSVAVTLLITILAALAHQPVALPKK